MLELNEWFFVQLINFFLLLFLLNKILYKPLLKNFDKRKSTINSYLKEVEEMEKRQKDLLLQIEEELKKARNKARETYESLRNEGITRQKAHIWEGEQAVQEMNEKILIELNKEVNKASALIKSKVKTFGDEIVKKIIEDWWK